MSVYVIGIMLFVAGMITGGGAVILHDWLVRRAVNAVREKKNSEIAKLRCALTRMQEDAGILQQASDCADAFRRGKKAGRADPMTGAEHFAQTFEGKNVRFVNTTRKEA